MGFGIVGAAFWMFIAAAAVAGIWSEVKSKEIKAQTTQKLIEHGKDLKPEDLEKILSLDAKNEDTMARDLKIGGLITMSVSPGLAILGYFVEAEPLYGISLLVLCISLGLLAASKYVADTEQKNNLL